MPKLFILVLSAAVFTLCANADTIQAFANRSTGTYLTFERDHGLRGNGEQFSQSALSTAVRYSKRPDGHDFSPSKPVWNLKPGDVTESTGESVNWSLSGTSNAPGSSFSGDKGLWTNPSKVLLATEVTAVPEPGTMGMIAVALTALALMRRKRLALRSHS